MNVHLMGSGAADGIPGLFSTDRVSQFARNHRGKDVRTRSGALVDGVLKIDFGPDTSWQAATQGVCPADWSAIVFTHSHSDHLAPQELQYSLYPFVDQEASTCAIYGNASVLDEFKKAYPDWPLELSETFSFQPYEVAGYQITPIAANHDADEDCQNVMVESEGKTLLYATDTGYWQPPTWEFLQGRKIDGLIIECTDGLVPSGYHGHLSVESCHQVVDRLKEMGCLSSGSKVVTTHHSHTGDGTHEELTKVLAPLGMEVGFDGMKFSL